MSIHPYNEIDSDYETEIHSTHQGNIVTRLQKSRVPEREETDNVRSFFCIPALSQITNDDQISLHAHSRKTFYFDISTKYMVQRNFAKSYQGLEASLPRRFLNDGNLKFLNTLRSLPLSSSCNIYANEGMMNETRAKVK